MQTEQTVRADDVPSNHHEREQVFDMHSKRCEAILLILSPVRTRNEG